MAVKNKACSNKSTFLLIIFILSTFFVVGLAKDDKKEDEAQSKEAENVKVDEEKLKYAKGSLCNYCDYCKFCKLCDEDCPCETSPSQPNCHMCKYCKFCHLCKVCDSICQPGGIIDRVTAALVNALPHHDPEEINKDIDGVKEWIDRKKDEL
ncbi:sarcoplasmic reticulum histidine-rich calcium-binding protein [Lingula anatina]|uniref:Sarcoplasmic reticulum histidine-rich calcium-binding protein n=1 Tax=Lingula anatina TaxID=7574 RepID=A0A1S3HZ74_LINAN|nr:sarcoplasmic reticulum histidine-rich calcium-binding protein [Lingula anatina]|eukprot:XP_013390384.1 sarcoplasmic reticulum histidine-rich calcium-binding protein [Lingula anatina]